MTPAVGAASRAGTFRFVMMLSLGLGVVLGSGGGRRVAGSDWPQWLGPNRDGVSDEAVSPQWSDDAPRQRWSHPVGAGYAGPAVARGRVWLHHRLKKDDVLECLDAATGKTVWLSPRPATYRDRFGFDEGPRAVPTVAGDGVYVLGAEGTLRCVTATNGATRWTLEAARVLGADQGFFGFACSPLVVSNTVVVQIGGKNGAGVIGVDTVTGAVRWKSTDHEAGYASPVAAVLGARVRAVCFTREGLAVLEVDTGRVVTSHPWRSRQSASVNAATPLVLGNRVFLTASYDTGAVLLDLSGVEPQRLWSGDESLSSHYASVVCRDGLVFGFHGRQEQGASLRCVELEGGRVRWSQDGLGSGSVVRAADHLVILTERGELIVTPASAEGFRPTARAQVLGAGIRAVPALADGALFARDPKRLVCLELRGGTGR